MVDAGAQASLKLVPLLPQSPKVAEVIRRSMTPSSGTHTHTHTHTHTQLLKKFLWVLAASVDSGRWAE